jgi:hypothetical protein
MAVRKKRILQIGRKKRVLQISETNTLEKPFLKINVRYKHFNYKPFLDNDNLIGMWERLQVICLNYKPDIILLNFKDEDCINDRERAMIQTFAVVIDIL